jgi:hypothetical protein
MLHQPSSSLYWSGTNSQPLLSAVGAPAPAKQAPSSLRLRRTRRFSYAAVYVGRTIAFAGNVADDWQRGCNLIAKAIELHPNHPGCYWCASLLNAYRKNDYRAALGIALKINMPGFTLASIALTAVYGQLGEKEAARSAMYEFSLGSRTTRRWPAGNSERSGTHNLWST